MSWKFIWGTLSVACFVLWAGATLLNMRVKPGGFPGFPVNDKTCPENCQKDQQNVEHRYFCDIRQFFHLLELKTFFQAVVGVFSTLAIVFFKYLSTCLDDAPLV